MGGVLWPMALRKTDPGRILGPISCVRPRETNRIRRRTRHIYPFGPDFDGCRVHPNGKHHRHASQTDHGPVTARGGIKYDRLPRQRLCWESRWSAMAEIAPVTGCEPGLAYGPMRACRPQTLTRRVLGEPCSKRKPHQTTEGA